MNTSPRMNKVTHGVLNEGGIFNCAIASYKFNLNVNAQFSFLEIALLYTEFWKDSEVHFSCNILFKKQKRAYTCCLVSKGSGQCTCAKMQLCLASLELLFSGIAFSSYKYLQR